MTVLESFIGLRRKYSTKKQYNYLGNIETSYANIVNPFRGSLIGGTPGSGKTFAIIEEYFRQFISKGFAGAFYDYKYPTLTKKLYNYVNFLLTIHSHYFHHDHQKLQNS